MKKYLRRLRPEIVNELFDQEFHLFDLMKIGLDKNVVDKLRDVNYLIDHADNTLYHSIISNNTYLALIATTFTLDEAKTVSFSIFSEQLDPKLLVFRLKTVDLSNKRTKRALIEFFQIQESKETEEFIYSSEITPQENKFYELLNYQFVAKEQIISILERNRALPRLILHMPTGTGKTKTAIHTIIQEYVLNRKNMGVIVWFAHTIELLNQAYRAFEENWRKLGNRRITVHFNDINSIDEKNAIYFVSYQKLVSLFKKNRDTFDIFRKSVAIIVADEAHKCLARETRKSVEGLMRLFPGEANKCLIGLTATPGRKLFAYDNMSENESLSDMFEKRIISVDPQAIQAIRVNEGFPSSGGIDQTSSRDSEIIKYFQKTNVLANIVREEIAYDLQGSNDPTTTVKRTTNKTGDYNQIFLHKIGSLSERNARIIKRLVKLALDRVPTIVFACSVEHGKYLEKSLSLLGLEAKGVYGDSPPLERKKTIENFNSGKLNILINFEVLTTGFDSPRIKCVFITRPTTSIVLYSQMLGRGLRGPKMGGNESCLLIDVKDNLNRFSDENQAFSYFSEYWRINQ